MRREYFSLEVSNVGWVESDADPELPELRITVEADPSELDHRFHGADGEQLEAAGTDVTFRLQETAEGEDATGVVSITDRLTGDYIVEVNVTADEIRPLIAAARRFGERTGDDTLYRVIVEADRKPVVTYEKRTLLVYGSDGELLRGRSLIPSGVEI